MPEYPITGVRTSTAAFVGPTLRGPFAGKKAPEALTSFAEFERVYGGLDDLTIAPGINYVAHAARAFFDEGGRTLYIARARAGSTGTVTAAAVDAALNSVADIGGVSVIAAPGSTELGQPADAIQALVIAHAEATGAYRFAVLDIPKGKTPTEASTYRRRLDSKFAAFYYPWVVTTNPLFTAATPAVPPQLTLPPSGFLCGIYARSDFERGVSKPPANEVVRGAIDLERRITKAEQDILNPDGVNCLRHFEGRGYRVWGARTASSDSEWKYVNVRRYFIYLEQSLDLGTRWAVFEPNDQALWSGIRQAVSAFLTLEWKGGALFGRKPEEAFFVRCDHTTMTQDDIDNGRLVCLVGVAPVKPAEFVIFRIGQWTADRLSPPPET